MTEMQTIDVNPRAIDHILNYHDGVLHNNIAKIVEYAWQEGGYIAGGFCAALLGALIQGSTLEIRAAAHNHFLKRGDIDVWFPSRTAFERFMKKTREYFPSGGERDFFRESRLKVALEHSEINLEKGGGSRNVQKVQIIKAPIYINPPEQQLKMFDITNARVAITRDKIIVDPRTIELNRNKELHVSHWGKYTVARTIKYVRAKGYQMSHDIASKLRDYALSEVQSYLDGDRVEDLKHPMQARNPFDRTMRSKGMNAQQKLQHVLKTLEKIGVLKTLTGEELLAVSFLACGKVEYDYALEELFRRSNVK